MGTNEVLDFLNKNKTVWFKRKDLRKVLKERCGDTSLRKLRRWNFVEWRPCKGLSNSIAYEYKYKKVKE